MRQDCKATITTCSSTFQRKMYYPGPHRLWRAVVRPCWLLLPAGKLETMEALGCVFPRPASCLCVPVSQSTTTSTTSSNATNSWVFQSIWFLPWRAAILGLIPSLVFPCSAHKRSSDSLCHHVSHAGCFYLSFVMFGLWQINFLRFQIPFPSTKTL